MNKVLLTRTAHREASLFKALNGRGLSVLQWPAIELKPRPLEGGLKALTEALDWADGIVFPSPGSVLCTCSLWPQFADLLAPRKVTVFAQGLGTQKVLQGRGIWQSVLPVQSDWNGLAAAVQKHLIGPQNLLLMVGNLANQELPKRLSSYGLKVRSLVLYENAKVAGLAQPSQPLLCAVYASPSAARYHLEENPWLHTVPAVAYGPTTAGWLKTETEIQRIECAKSPSWAAVFEAIEKTLEGRS